MSAIDHLLRSTGDPHVSSRDLVEAMDVMDKHTRALNRRAEAEERLTFWCKVLTVVIVLSTAVGMLT